MTPGSGGPAVPDAETTILVVDNLPTMRRVIRGALRDLGFTNVVEAEDGQQALARLREHGADLVISEWAMPNVDGLEMIRRIRADAALADTPVLMVTAEARRKNIVAAVEAGTDGYVVKPFTLATLEAKIQQLFGGS